MRKIVILVAAVFQLTCASLGDVGLQIYPRMVMQRDSTDCAIATLAMLTKQRYETIAEDARLVAGDFYAAGGLTPKQMALVAGHFGHTLSLHPPGLMAAGDAGIMLMRWADGTPSTHAIYIFRQMAYDPLQPEGVAYVKLLTSGQLIPLWWLRDGG